MNLERNTEFPFVTEAGEEIMVKGTIVKSSYGDYLDTDTLSISSLDGKPFDEDLLTDEDFDRMESEAIHYEEEDSIHR